MTITAPAHADAYVTPLDAFDVSDPQFYQDDTWYP